MLTVYTTKTCAYCPMVKTYLKNKNVAYKEVDVTDDMATRQELMNKTGMQTVPVTTNGSDFVVGWNAGALAKMLANTQAQAV